MKKKFVNVHIHQNRNAAPIPIQNFCMILITLILVKFKGLSKKEDKNVAPKIKSNFDPIIDSICNK